MQMQITVDLEDDVIRKVVEEAVRFSFKGEHGRPQYSGVGYNSIVNQVNQVVASLDLTKTIREAAEKYGNGIAEDITRESIRRMVKEVVKSERDAGTLFPLE